MNKHPPHCYQHFTSSIEDQQDVLQLDVAMDDALAVQVAQLHQEALGVLLLQFEALLASNRVVEIASRVKVKQQAVEFADREDPAQGDTELCHDGRLLLPVL